MNHVNSVIFFQSHDFLTACEELLSCSVIACDRLNCSAPCNLSPLGELCLISLLMLSVPTLCSAVSKSCFSAWFPLLPWGRECRVLGQCRALYRSLCMTDTEKSSVPGNKKCVWFAGRLTSQRGCKAGSRTEPGLGS